MYYKFGICPLERISLLVSKSYKWKITKQNVRRSFSKRTDHGGPERAFINIYKGECFWHGRLQNVELDHRFCREGTEGRHGELHQCTLPSAERQEELHKHWHYQEMLRIGRVGRVWPKCRWNIIPSILPHVCSMCRPFWLYGNKVGHPTLRNMHHSPNGISS